MNERTAAWLPTWLRVDGQAERVLQIPVGLGPLLADAIEIADESARVTVRSALFSKEAVTLPAPNRYYDTRSAEPQDLLRAAQRVRYLLARGLIERHPEQEHLVRVLDEVKEVA